MCKDAPEPLRFVELVIRFHHVLVHEPHTTNLVGLEHRHELLGKIHRLFFPVPHDIHVDAAVRVGDIHGVVGKVIELFRLLRKLGSGFGFEPLP